MKIIGRHFWFVLIISALLVACNPTEVEAQSTNNEQRLVGTWTNLHGGPNVVFNEDGTITGLPAPTSGWAIPTHWAAAGNIVILFRTDRNERSMVVFNISSDGRTLTFTGGLSGVSNLALRRN